MATALGTAYLKRWREGDTTLRYLTRAMEVGWISQQEYDEALVECPPVDPNSLDSVSTCSQQQATTSTAETPAPA